MSAQNICDVAPADEPTGAMTQHVKDSIFVAFDTETTGLSPVVGKLVELSGVKFRADGSELSTFQSLINPEIPIPEGASAIHGIYDEDVFDQPTANEVIASFFDWVNQPEGTNEPAVLLAHNAPFDVSFLEVALCKNNLPMPENIVLDTLPLARATMDASNYQLRTLVEQLGLGSDTYHRALADSLHVKNLFLRILDCFADDATIGDIASAGEIVRFLDRSNPEADSIWNNRPEFISIKDAIESGADLRINYSGARKTQRVVTPRSVLFTRGKPYLSAFCHMAAAERTFRIDRIIQVEALVGQK